VFNDIGALEVVTLAVLAVIVFGPEKLPKVIQDAARFVRKIREFSESAKQDIRSELGPEFSDFDLDSLNPRSFVRKNLFEDDDDEPSGATRATPQRPASKVNGEQVPYDPDTI